MYRLLVYYPDKAAPHVTLAASNGAEALTLIQTALDEHDGCERVVVMLGEARLFSVDCHGNRHP